MQGKAKGFSLFFDQKSLRKKKATFADRMDTKKRRVAAAALRVRYDNAVYFNQKARALTLCH